MEQHQACREATPQEWAASLWNDREPMTEARLALVITMAIERGRHHGRRSLESAVTNFEWAYRSAVQAQERIGKTGPGGETEADYVNDAFEAAKIAARMGYQDWLGKDFDKPRGLSAGVEPDGEAPSTP